LIILEHESSGWGLKGAALCFLAVAYLNHNASLANGKQLHSNVVIWEIIQQTLELLRERNSAYPDEVIPELEEYLFDGAFVFLEVFYSKCFNISLCNHNDSLARDVSNDLYVELMDTKANIQSLITCIRNAGFKGNRDDEEDVKELPAITTHKTSMTSAEVQSQSSDKAKPAQKAHKNANDAFQLIVAGLRRDIDGQKRIDLEFRDMGKSLSNISRKLIELTFTFI
jgi:hypothetical protein